MADARSVAVLAGSRHCGDSKCGIGGIMWDQVKRLHEYHGDVPVEMRLLKLTEDHRGSRRSSRSADRGARAKRPQGVCHTRDDLLDELADVIITAAVAMSAVTGGGVDEARSHFDRRLEIVTARADCDRSRRRSR